MIQYVKSILKKDGFWCPIQAWSDPLLKNRPPFFKKRTFNLLNHRGDTVSFLKPKFLQVGNIKYPTGLKAALIVYSKFKMISFGKKDSTKACPLKKTSFLPI